METAISTPPTTSGTTGDDGVGDNTFQRGDGLRTALSATMSQIWQQKVAPSEVADRLIARLSLRARCGEHVRAVCIAVAERDSEHNATWATGAIVSCIEGRCKEDPC